VPGLHEKGTTVKFEILILTLPSRTEFLRQLLTLLEPQISALGLRKYDQVGVRIVKDEAWSRPMELGDKREYMRQQSHAEYSCWLDDDDLPAPNYISSILPLLDGIDYVGFRLQMYRDWVKAKPTFHSLRYKSWWEDDAGYYRDLSHLNPIRNDLAKRAPVEGNIVGEDFRWANRLRSLGIVKTEHFVDDVLYFYLERRIRHEATDAHDPRRLALIESLYENKITV
jgi:hypothetical protein